jgi:hypothetical protein
LVTSNRFKVFTQLVENYQGAYLSDAVSPSSVDLLDRSDISNDPCKVCTCRFRNTLQCPAHPLHFNAFYVNICRCPSRH